MATPPAPPLAATDIPGPVGREPLMLAVAGGVDARLVLDGATAILARPGEDDRAVPLSERPGAHTLRGLRSVTVAAGAVGSQSASRWLRDLAATGTVLVAEDEGGGWDAGVLAVARESLPAPDDVIGWERRSVRQRRAALVATRDEEGTGWPGATAVLCTRRPERLVRAVEQISAQRYDPLQVVVVCHGAGFDDALLSAATEQVARPLTVISVDAAVPFGTALQRGCERAAGRLVTKVDDDDEYGPWHVHDLVLAHGYSGATVVGKFPSAVYLEELDQTVWRDDHPPERFDARVAGGTLLLSRDDLVAAGGWPSVAHGVDTRLIEAVAAAGGTVYRTHPLGYLLTRHSDRHTWQVDDGAFLRTSSRQWLGRLRGDPRARRRLMLLDHRSTRRTA